MKKSILSTATATFIFASMNQGFAEEKKSTVSVDSETEASSFEPNKPLWEVKLGGSGLYGPDYPGAEDNSLQGVGAPLLIYRGKRIRFGEYGVARAIAAETKTFELDVSLDAAYSASSNDDGIRSGMPDLDYLFQAGPQIVWNIDDTGWTSEGRQQWRFHLPVRAVASTDFQSIDHVGYIAEPQIIYQSKQSGDRISSWSVSLFSTLADDGLANYWYGVDDEFATIERPSYDATGGYISSGFRASWTRELTDDFQLFLTYQGRSLSGSENQDSPLLREDLTHALSVSFLWKVGESKRKAQNNN